MFFIIAQSFVFEYIKRNLIINLYNNDVQIVPDIEIGIPDKYSSIQVCYSTQEELDKLV